MMHKRYFSFIVAVAMIALPAFGQLPIGQNAGRMTASSVTMPPTAPPIDPLSHASPTDPQVAQQRIRAERQKQLVLDATKLLAMANELKDEADKSSMDTLSVDIVHKTDEIEKLAHRMKQKMKGN